MEKIKQILVIDDDSIDNFVSKTLIEKSNLVEQVITHDDARNAINYLKDQILENPVDLPNIIFLDINMPSMSGWEFLKEYNEIDSRYTADISLIIFSSYIHAEEVRRLMSFKCVNCYQRKPLSLPIVKKICLEYLEDAIPSR
jgi:CheY-like chemotaxis protein